VGGIGNDPYQEQITFIFSSATMRAHGLDVAIPPLT
jgi:hypothetical protein